MKGLLSYVAGDSLLHRLDPLTKLLLAVLLCAASFTSTSHLFLLGLIALNLFLGWSAGIFRQTAAILSKLMGLSVFMFLLQLLFIRDGEALFTVFGFAITGKAVYFGSLMVLRLVAATMPLTIMLSVTQMNDLSNVLVQKLHIPYKYAFTITTAIRFIPYFSDEMAGIMEAQTARGVEFDTRNVFKKLRMILPLCAPLLITSVKKNRHLRHCRRASRLSSAQTREQLPAVRLHRRRLAGDGRSRFAAGAGRAGQSADRLTFPSEISVRLRPALIIPS